MFCTQGSRPKGLPVLSVADLRAGTYQCIMSLNRVHDVKEDHLDSYLRETSLACPPAILGVAAVPARAKPRAVTTVASAAAARARSALRRSRSISVAQPDSWRSFASSSACASQQ